MESVKRASEYPEDITFFVNDAIQLGYVDMLPDSSKQNIRDMVLGFHSFYADLQTGKNYFTQQDIPVSFSRREWYLGKQCEKYFVVQGIKHLFSLEDIYPNGEVEKMYDVAIARMPGKDAKFEKRMYQTLIEQNN